MIYDHDIEMYGIEGALKKKRCGRLGVYIEALDKCVYPMGGYGTVPDGPDIPKAEKPKQAVPTPQALAKQIASEMQNRNKTKATNKASI